jgi:hypothetical protein
MTSCTRLMSSQACATCHAVLVRWMGLLLYRRDMYSFRTPQKKSLFLPCPHQSAPLSIYNLVLAAPIRRGKMPSEPQQGTQRFNFCPSSKCCCSHYLAVGGGLQKLAIPVWTRPTGALGGSFPLMTRQILKSSYFNPHQSAPPQLLYISGGVSSPHPPKTLFLRRDILFVR